MPKVPLLELQTPCAFGLLALWGTVLCSTLWRPAVLSLGVQVLVGDISKFFSASRLYSKRLPELRQCREKGALTNL